MIQAAKSVAICATLVIVQGCSMQQTTPSPSLEVRHKEVKPESSLDGELQSRFAAHPNKGLRQRVTRRNHEGAAQSAGFPDIATEVESENIPLRSQTSSIQPTEENAPSGTGLYPSRNEKNELSKTFKLPVPSSDDVDVDSETSLSTQASIDLLSSKSTDSSAQPDTIQSLSGSVPVAPPPPAPPLALVQPQEKQDDNGKKGDVFKKQKHARNIKLNGIPSTTPANKKEEEGKLDLSAILKPKLKKIGKKLWEEPLPEDSTKTVPPTVDESTQPRATYSIPPMPTNIFENTQPIDNQTIREPCLVDSRTDQFAQPVDVSTDNRLSQAKVAPLDAITLQEASVIQPSQQPSDRLALLAHLRRGITLKTTPSPRPKIVSTTAVSLPESLALINPHLFHPIVEEADDSDWGNDDDLVLTPVLVGDFARPPDVVEPVRHAMSSTDGVKGSIVGPALVGNFAVPKSRTTEQPSSKKIVVQMITDLEQLAVEIVGGIHTSSGQSEIPVNHGEDTIKVSSVSSEPNFFSEEQESEQSTVDDQVRMDLMLNDVEHDISRDRIDSEPEPALSLKLLKEVQLVESTREHFVDPYDIFQSVGKKRKAVTRIGSKKNKKRFKKLLQFLSCAPLKSTKPNKYVDRD